MPAMLECQIPKESWVSEAAAPNGKPTNDRPRPTTQSAVSWERAVQTIVEMHNLGDDWDGLGAIPPSRELLESALGLAHLLSDKGMEPPLTVVAGTDGSVNFGWQDADGGYAEVEVVRPFFAEVMVIEAGKPAKHWTLPTE